MIELRNCPQIEAPCQALPRFASGQKSAFCDLCQRHVHNLSALTAAEQAELLAREARPCVRYRMAGPLLAAALLSGASTSALAQEQLTEQDDQIMEELVITGGAMRQTIPVFLQTELPEEFDERPTPQPDSDRKPPQ